jgi:molybdopterin converting factor small subunit
MKILFYGRLAEAIASELEVDAAPDCSIGDLRERLIAAHPEAQEPLRSKRARACVGDAIVDDSYRIQPADRVEFLPAVSGG